MYASDTACTTDEEAVAALTAAKAAMGAAGLDPAKRLEPVPATGGEGEPRDLRRPNESRRSLDLGEGHVLDVVLTHESDQGYHTYTATVSSQGRALLAYELSPNPSMAGSGDIEVVGAISDGDRAIVVFEESWGPGGRWDNWVFGPVLVLD